VLKRLLSLLSDSATYGISSLLAQVIGFILLPLYTRYLEPADYGLLAVLNIYTMLFLPVANLGMTNALFRNFNLQKTPELRDKVLGTGFISVTSFSMILGILCLIFVTPVTEVITGKAENVHLMQLTIITGILTSIAQVPKVILRADRRVKTTSGINIIILIASILLTFLYVVGLDQGVAGAVRANLLASVLNLLVSYSFVIKILPFVFERSTFRNMLSYGLPFLPHRLQGVGFAQFGVYVISQMLGADEAGLYSITMRIVLPLTFAINAIQQAWVPFKFQIFAEDDDDPTLFFASILTYYFAGVSYLWVGVSLWGPEVIRAIMPAEYHDASYLVPFIGLISLTTGLYYMLGTGLELSNDTRLLPVISFVSFLVLVACTLVSVPYLGPYGAALATIAGLAVQSYLIFRVSQTRIRINYNWPVLALFGGFALTFVLTGVLAQQLPVILRLLTLVTLSIIYPILALFILYRSPEEKERIILLRDRALQIRG
jgi:O-antigen/teichoic acid export membrane protein